MKTNLLILLLFFITNFSFAQSFNEVKKSAEQGNAEAQFSLGLMYSKGEGTLTDKKKAFYWIKKSAEQGKQKHNSILDICIKKVKGR